MPWKRYSFDIYAPDGWIGCVDAEGETQAEAHATACERVDQEIDVGTFAGMLEREKYTLNPRID